MKLNRGAIIILILVLIISSIPAAATGTADLSETEASRALLEMYQDLTGGVSLQADSSEPGFAEGQILVRFSPEAVAAASESHNALGTTVLRDFSPEGATGLQLVELPSTLSVPDAVAAYGHLPGVLYAEPDYLRFADRIPDDPEFFRQWGLSNTGQVYRENITPGLAGADISAPQAWDITTSGNGVIVAVIDTGVDYLHPDLAANIWTDPDTGAHGYDSITGNLDPMDLASHGSHCAGIIGGVGNNSLGISGVTWDASIMPIRILNSFGTGTVSDGISGILWASAHGADIYSCSYGSMDFSRAEYDLMNITPGLFVCSAGNSNINTDTIPQYPACYNLSRIISVAATNTSDGLADFSNYGQESVDIGAPGVEIYSTLKNQYSPIPLWHDPFTSYANWTISGNWTLDTRNYVSPPSSALGLVNRTGPGSTDLPLILTLNQPLNMSGVSNPVIVYQWEAVGSNFAFSLEGSTDGLLWKSLEYTEQRFLISPFIQRSSKIPSDMQGGPLFIRFVADGQFCLIGIDDVVLSDGYGAKTMDRWGYMSGTSMATPMVSGMATMLSSYAPDATVDEIKDAILSGADPLPGLQGKTMTGGRANLSASLIAMNPPEPDHLILAPGWNQISFAKRLLSGKDTAQEVFGSLTNTSGHSVLTYVNNTWQIVPAEQRITPLSAYWVWTDSSAFLPLAIDPAQSGVYEQNLTSGWNGFGVVGTDILPAKVQMEPISGNWSYLVGFNATTQVYDEPIIRGGTGGQSDERTLSPWQGYWCYVTGNVTYLKPVV